MNNLELELFTAAQQIFAIYNNEINLLKAQLKI